MDYAGKKIVVVGGSIAGCAITIQLQRLGADVTLLERSSGLVNQGAGVTLPVTIINQCIELDLFDKNIPRLACNSRSFSRKDANRATQTFWQQPLHAMTMNWLHIYQNLRARIKPASFHNHTELKHIHQRGDTYQLETSTGVTYNADLIVAADGVDSSVRKQLIPESNPQYVGYIAWRGLIDHIKLFEHDHVSYFVYPKGHILLYNVPAQDYERTGNTRLNWLMYEDRKSEPLDHILIDKYGNHHSRSVPAGSLSDQQINHLHQFAKEMLPAAIADIIGHTPKPFLQGIFDFQLSDYEAQHVLFVGDAAVTLRPHTGSGVFKALADGIALAKLFESNQSNDLSQLTPQWRAIQRQTIAEEAPKAIAVGRAIVTDQPNWADMNQETMDEWWANVMHGSSWYATKMD